MEQWNLNLKCSSNDSDGSRQRHRDRNWTPRESDCGTILAVQELDGNKQRNPTRTGWGFNLIRQSARETMFARGRTDVSLEQWIPSAARTIKGQRCVRVAAVLKRSLEFERTKGWITLTKWHDMRMLRGRALFPIARHSITIPNDSAGKDPRLTGVAQTDPFLALSIADLYYT